ncbi:MAG: hypothetical protein HY901_38545 [Deltaproteobacteria bacterium]|nr:hypothetical protein [Deltaproteobacteria bacterium]
MRPEDALGRAQGALTGAPQSRPARPRCFGARGVAAAIALLLVVGQVLALAHLVSHAHVWRPESGRVGHPLSPLSERSEQCPPQDRDSRSEECQVFALLSQAQELPSPLPGLAAPASSEHWTLPASTRIAPALPWELYLLAPSHSPPRSGCC